MSANWGHPHTLWSLSPTPSPLLQIGLAACSNWTPVDDFSQLGGEVGTQAQEMDSGEFVPSAKKKISSCNKTPTKPALCHIHYIHYIHIFSPILIKFITGYFMTTVYSYRNRWVSYMFSYDRRNSTPRKQSSFLTDLVSLSSQSNRYPRCLLLLREVELDEKTLRITGSIGWFI